MGMNPQITCNSDLQVINMDIRKTNKTLVIVNAWVCRSDWAQRF